jgi:replicative DNA helicase
LAVVAVCQLNRAVEDRLDQKPRLSDLRESGDIEHANTVLLLHRPGGQADDAPAWRIDVIVAKNRNGPTGDLSLNYRRPLMWFENLPIGA